MLIPMVTLALCLALVPGFTSAQSTGPTTGPDSDIIIICDSDDYSADIFGNIDIYCDISNNGVPAKAMKVGAVFDDYLGTDVEIVEVNVDGSPVTRGLTKLPPQADKVKTRVLSLQVVNILSGQSKQLHLKIKVPVPSQGKFDVLFGDPDVGGEYRLDPWWDTDWQYKACWNLSGHTRNLTGDMAGLSYGYPFNLTMNTQSLIGASKMQADCDDIRLIYNETTDVKFFTRDCGATVSEVWGAWNFTIGESYDFCVYYGNTTVTSNETDPYDIVWIWEDFQNASAFNSTGNWQSAYVCQSGTKVYGPANVSGGKMTFKDPSGICTGNNGEWFWRDDLHINVSEMGFLTDTVFWYNVPNDGWGQRKPALIRNSATPTRDANYGIPDSKSVWFRFISQLGAPYDYHIEAYGNAWSTYFLLRNSSNSYTTQGYTERNLWSYNPETYNFTLRGNYTGQPYTDPILFDNFPLYNSTTQQIDPYYIATYLSEDATFEFGSSKGGTKTSDWSTYEYWFVRPLLTGEPNAVGGAEVPLDNGTLSIQYVSPTPANNTNTTDIAATINVSSNKTIEWCKLNWDGTNYSMTTDTTYCYFSRILTGTPVYYDVFVEDLWGYSEQTPQQVITGTDDTALLGVPFDIIDFNFSSSSYVTGANVTFNTSASETGLIVMTSMNIEKVSGVSQNVVSARVIVDGNTLADEVIRSVSTVGEEGSTGISPVAFNVSAGEHYIQIDFKRTGDGIISVNDIDVSMGQLVTTSGGTVNGNISTGNFTHNSSSFGSVYNFTFAQFQTADTFFTTHITIGADATTDVLYQYQNIDNTSQLSPYGARYISDASDVGSMSGVFIDSFPAGDVNMTILGSSSTGANVNANYTNLLFVLEDNYTKTIDNFQESNPSTSNVSSINITDTYTLLDSASQTVKIGDGYFIGFYGYYQSNDGAQTVTHKINATGTSCETKKERYLSDNSDIGFTYMYFICDNLTTTTYDFQVWAKADTGKSIDHYDDSFAGFEVNTFDITEGNIAPFPGVITNPVNASVQQTEVNITWSPWTDPNGNFDDYNISLLNDDGSFNSTLDGSTTDEYYVLDILSYPSGLTLGIEVEGCDTEPLCTSAPNVYFEVENLPIYSNFAGDPETTNFSAVPDLTNVTAPVLADSNVKIEWIGSGFNAAGADFDSNIIYAYNSVDADTTTFPTFDAPATVTLKGVTYLSTSQYRVLRDGSPCTDCVIISANPATFTVTGFSVYTTEYISATEAQPMLLVIPLIIAIAMVLSFVGAFIGGLLDLKSALLWIVILTIALVMIGIIFVI